MSRGIAAALFGLILASATLQAQNDVSGSWDLTINGPQGSITAGATLKQTGDIVTGTLSSPQGDAEVKGSIKGATLSLAFTVQSPQGALDIKITGEVDGKTMKGVIDFGAGTADFTGTKK